MLGVHMAGETIGDRLERARERTFVGRVAEQELWAAALARPMPDFAVLWLHGPGGVGKTSLLARLARIARESGVVPISLDARELVATPDSLHALLRRELGLGPSGDVNARLRDGVRRAILIDTAELFGPLEDWLRTQFVPSLPSDCPVAIAGRNAPAAAWRSDPGWCELLRVVSLRNLAPSESRAFLQLRGVPSHRHAELLASTHGHPLALTLVAEIAQQAGEHAPLDPARSADVLRVLLERFLERAPDEQHRLALGAAAHTRVINEARLRALIDADAAPALYRWLSGLSFAERGPEGVHLHELAAECVDAELRARDPTEYTILHGRLRDSILQTMLHARGAEQLRAASDFCWMHRYSPVTQPMVDWSFSRSLYAGPPSAADCKQIVDAVRHFEGDAPASATRYWLDHQPGAFTVVRSSPLQAIGFMCTLLIEHADDQMRAVDARVAAALDHARATAPLREGESIEVLFWLGYEGHQDPRPMYTSLTIQSLLTWVNTPRLAFSYHAVAGLPEVWLPFQAYIDHHPSSTLTFGKTQVVLCAHDWRRAPLEPFLAMMNERELHGGVEPPPSEQAALLVLSQEDFVEAVRCALREYTREVELARNPLCRCRVVLESPDHDAPPPSGLRAVLKRAADTIHRSPKDDKLYSALVLTYLDPAPTQEIAAERLGLPFSTYRRHLAASLERVVDWLWQRELHGWSANG